MILISIQRVRAISIRHLVTSPGSLIVWVSRPSAWIWQRKQHTESFSFVNQVSCFDIDALAVSDSGLLAAGASSGKLFAWNCFDMDTKPLYSVQHHEHFIVQLTVNSDTLVATSSGLSGVQLSSNGVLGFKLHSSSRVDKLQLTSDSKLLVCMSSHYRSILCVWDVCTGVLIHSFMPKFLMTNFVLNSHNTTLMAVHHQQQTAHCLPITTLDYLTGTVLSKMSLPSSGFLYPVVFSSDNTLLACQAGNCKAFVFDLTTQCLVLSLDSNGRVGGFV